MNKQDELRVKAHKYIPGGAHTYSRGDDQYSNNTPSVLHKGEGAYVWDVDGNKYLDYGMGLRSVTLGYRNQRVNDAAISAINLGNNLTRPSLVEVEAAELLCNIIPGCDMVKFAKNGSTATSAAIKLARAHTGKKIALRCVDHPFFSYDDWFIGDTQVKAGIPSEVKALTRNFAYNDAKGLEKLLSEIGDDVSCIIMEPMRNVEPIKAVLVEGNDKNFLHDVRFLCDKYNVVFVLDEMITGFRWQFEGASAYYNVMPDLRTFGKGMANGFSVAALAGKKEIMELGGIHHDRERVFLISSTHGAEMCGLAAFIETMKIYQEEPVIEHIWNYGRSIEKEFNNVLKEKGLSDYFKFQGSTCCPDYYTFDKDNKFSLGMRTLFLQEMVKNGVIAPWLSYCYSHGEAELNTTVNAFSKTMDVYAKALENGFESFVEGDIVKPVFRKFN